MRLLFDQNISYRIISLLENDFPNCVQVKALGLQDKTDREIWNYAKANDLTIVTFDADFFDFASLLGHPPKIVWLRIGNTTTNDLANYMIQQKESINAFMNHKEFNDVACLELH
jgi:predicted nuclease of predicted toxin-antitoxin system